MAFKKNSQQTYIDSLFFQRLILLSALFLFSLFLIRLIDVQLVKGNAFLKQAESNRQFQFVLPAPRGVFLDRYGDNLVFNQKQYYRYTDQEALFSSLQYLDTQEAKQYMATASAHLPFRLTRHYLYPEVTAHSLGYIGPIQKEDLAEDSSLDLSDYLGKFALEKRLESRLRGLKGKEIFEVDSFGKKKRRIVSQEPQAGQSIQTTLDPYLSRAAHLAMQGKKGAVLIADASNGEILTLISHPSFDSNVLSNTYTNEALEKQRQLQVSQYLKDENQVFFNRAIGGNYPPGSIFKLITALAGLETNSINENTVVNDEGILKVGDFEYANWYYTQYGRVEGDISLVRAIARSNDIYFYKAAEFTGVEQIAAMARNFGLGSITGVELTGEAKGLVPDPAWKEEVKGERWYLGNTYHYGIGQGDILLTPIQVLQLGQAIANQGSLCKPHLIKHQETDCRDLALQSSNLDLVIEGMLAACSTGGTAYPIFAYNQSIDDDSYDFEQRKDKLVACKTGTAEFGGTDEQGYRNTHAWLVAIVPTRPLLAQAKQAPVATASGQLLSASQDYLHWQEKIALVTDSDSPNASSSAEQNIDLTDKSLNFPEKLVFVVLVESDELNPFREGSQDAAPVVEQLLDWMRGK